MGLTVVFPFPILGDDGDGLGGDGQLAVLVGNGVVLGHIRVGSIPNRHRNGVVGRAVPHVGDLKEGVCLGSVAVHKRGVLADGVTAPAMGFSVVDPVVILGQDGNGTLMHRQRAFRKGDGVVVEGYGAVAARNSHAASVNGDRRAACVGLRADEGRRQGLAVCQAVNGYGRSPQGGSVVDLFRRIRRYGDGARRDGEHTRGLLEGIVGGLICSGAIPNGQHKAVFYGALVDVGDARCLFDGGGVTLDQGRLGGDGEAAVGMGRSVILEGFVLGGKADQPGLYGELAVYVADVVVARDVSAVRPLDGDLQSVVRSALRRVGDGGAGGDEGGLARGDLLVGGDREGLVGMGCAVVDPAVIRGGYGDRSLVYGDGGLGHEYGVILGDIPSVLVVDIKEQKVVYGGGVGDLGAARHRGRVALCQRGASRDKEFLMGLGGSRVFQRGVLHVDLDGVLMHREQTRHQGDPVIGGHVQAVKAHDLDLGGVGGASHVGDGISEGGDQPIRRAVLVDGHRACGQLVAVKGEGEAVVDALGVGHRNGDLAGDELDLPLDGVDHVGVCHVIPLGI